MQKWTGRALSVLGALLALWSIARPIAWQLGVLIALCMVAVGLAMVLDEAEQRRRLEPASARRRRAKRGERAFRVSARVPLSRRFHEDLRAQLVERELADGLVVIPGPVDDEVIVSWKVLATGRRHAEEVAAEEISQAGFVHDGIRVA